MPCRTELFKCDHCDRDVYDVHSNGCKDHAVDCPIAGGNRSSRKLDDLPHLDPDLHMGGKTEEERGLAWLAEQNHAPKTKRHDYKGMLCEALKLAKEWCPKGTNFVDAVYKQDPRLIEFMIEHAEEDKRKSK